MSAADTTLPPTALPADVRILNKVVNNNGLYIVGTMKSPAAGVEQDAYLVIDMNRGEIVLTAACGCRTGVSLSLLLLKLGASLAQGHGLADADHPSPSSAVH